MRNNTNAATVPDMTSIARPSAVLDELRAAPNPQTAEAVVSFFQRFASSYKHHFPSSQCVGGYNWTCPKGMRSIVASGYNLFKKSTTPPAHTRKRVAGVVLLQAHLNRVIKLDLTNEQKLVRIKRLLYLYLEYRIQRQGSIRFASMGAAFDFSQLLLAKAFDVTIRLPDDVAPGYLDYEEAVDADRSMPRGLGLATRTYAGVLARVGDLYVNSNEYSDLTKQLTGAEARIVLSNLMDQVVEHGGYHEVAFVASAVSP
ncbi:MAG: hypothetical protein P1U34_04130 [Coxiellaceae bacterium]|nr:hypothetical protein [Coxiellaceae bacterium]